MVVNNKNSSYRKIEIKNFRNIGYEDPTSITINRSLNKEELGELVIIAGLNNTGKSNVLAAILACQNGFSSKDYNDFSLTIGKKSPTPTVSLVIKDGKDFEEITYNMGEKNKEIADYQIGKIYEIFISILNRGYNSSSFKSDDIKRGVISESFLKFLGNYMEKSENNKRILVSLSKLIESKGKRDGGRYGIRHLKIDGTFPIDGIETPITKLDDGAAFEKKYGYKLIPNISEYVQKPVYQEDCNCTFDKINPMIASVLSSIGYTLENMRNIILSYVTSQNWGVIDAVQGEMNNRLKDITKKFNRMYSGTEKYDLRIRLASETIHFYVNHGNRPVNLDKQSTGFKWFFDFYFNFVLTNQLEWGDIVILDEPATNLHPTGQTELRETLKDLAKKLGVTFVMSTHSPFFIDLDHLDEIRVVVRQIDGSSMIIDKFSEMDSDNVDQLATILDTMTVKRHVLVNPRDRTIFVEGITDYNYLIMFKKILMAEKGLEDLSTLRFIPINGLKKPNILKVLKSIEKYPIILVDGDKTGLDFKEKNEKDASVCIMSLDEFGKGFKTIESLFTEKDKKILSPDGNGDGKEFNRSSVMKNNFKVYSKKFSQETKDNFEKVLQGLLEDV